jgi:hypothetical protein
MKKNNYFRISYLAAIFLFVFSTFLSSCSSKPKKAANKFVEGVELCFGQVSPESFSRGNVSADEMANISDCIQKASVELTNLTKSFNKDQYDEFETECKILALKSKYKDVFAQLGIIEANSSGSKSNMFEKQFERQRINDSIRVNDSLAMVIYKEQLIADSIVESKKK